MKNQDDITLKALRMAQYRERLDKLNLLLKNKYNLSDMEGAAKQISWATDIRTKFLEEFDKQYDDLDQDVRDSIIERVLSHTESRWWIDRKDAKYSDFMIFAKTLLNVKTNKITDSSNVIDDSILIDTCHNTRITISSNLLGDLSDIMNQYKFTLNQNDKCWFRDIPVEDNARVGIVESLCLTLLANGYKIQVISSKPKDIKHDGILKMIGDMLCIEARTEAVYKTASSIGARLVYLKDCNKSDIQLLINSYDVVCTDKAQLFINDLYE